MSDPKPCILVVDDDEDIVRMVQLALRSSNARVVTHGRAFGVLQLIATEAPDVVVLDVMMPGLDGPSIVELIREDAELARTRVVLWSALGLEELEELGRSSGADGVLEKVRGPRALVAQLTVWLSDWDGVVLR